MKTVTVTKPVEHDVPEIGDKVIVILAFFDEGNDRFESTVTHFGTEDEYSRDGKETNLHASMKYIGDDVDQITSIFAPADIVISGKKRDLYYDIDLDLVVWDEDEKAWVVEATYDLTLFDINAHDVHQ